MTLVNKMRDGWNLPPGWTVNGPATTGGFGVSNSWIIKSVPVSLVSKVSQGVATEMASPVGNGSDVVKFLPRRPSKLRTVLLSTV